MLSLSQTTGYAIRALTCLRFGESAALVMAKDIAEATGIPLPYLSKLMHALGQAGLITTKRGYRGGFALARPAEAISLMDITEAIEGPNDNASCLLGLETCSDERACPLHRFWKQERQRIEKAMCQMTLREVAKFEAHLMKATGVTESQSKGEQAKTKSKSK
ncbi:MAG: Rrf2 family transcriptional regulator [Phycisphaeraceae bacterium]